MLSKEILRPPFVAGALAAAALAVIGLVSVPASARHRDGGPAAVGHRAGGHGPGGAALASFAVLGAVGPLGPLTELAVRRIRLGEEVAAAKYATGAPVDDPARERQELDGVRRRAAEAGLDPEETARFFQDQIAASKTVQRGLLARWQNHPEEAPAKTPALAGIRARLDVLTGDMVRELAATREARGSGAACAADLAAAGAAAERTHGLDALRRRALDTALRSVCSRA